MALTGIWDRNNLQILGGDTPTRRTLLLGHGLGCDQSFWRPMAERLADTYRVVLFDYVGSGRSDRSAYQPTRYASLEGYSHDLVEIAQSLDCAEIDFVGHSISSMIGLLAAIQAPPLFRSLAMVAPSPRFLNDPANAYVGGFEPHDIEAYFEVMELNFVGWASSFAVLAAGPDKEAAERLYQCFCNTDPRVIRTFAKITLEVDLRAQLSQFKGPSLILQCLQDVLAPVGVGQFMHEQMVDSQLEVLDIQGHIPHLTHPELVEHKLRRFLERAAA